MSDERRTTMTISILEADKKTLQKFAIDNGKTVSKVIHEWVCAHCGIQEDAENEHDA